MFSPSGRAGDFGLCWARRRQFRLYLFICRILCIQDVFSLTCKFYVLGDFSLSVHLKNVVPECNFKF